VVIDKMLLIGLIVGPTGVNPAAARILP